jgi:hypothetical protein
VNTQQIERVDAPTFGADHQLPAMTSITPMAMIGQAVSKGAGIDVIEKLMGLQERWDAHQARKAFDEAMALAKAEIPVIAKNRRVFFEAKDRDKRATDYNYEDLGEIARTIDPILGRHGLSYRFRPTSKPNEPVTVTCIISHRLGHFEESTLSAGADNSGNKNSIQAIGSTITFLQRYTLKAALGLAAAKDDDGRSADGERDEAPAPRPKPPNPNAPPPTGPRLLPVNGRDAVTWTDALWAEIAKSASGEEIDKWLAANKAPVDELEQHAPQVAASLYNDVAVLRAKLTKPAAPKPPNPNAQPEDDGIPENLRRRPKPTLKDQLLTAVSALANVQDGLRFATDPDVYKRKQEMAQADRDTLDLAYMRKMDELQGR